VRAGNEPADRRTWSVLTVLALLILPILAVLAVNAAVTTMRSSDSD
jgi:nitrate reductase NapE component